MGFATYTEPSADEATSFLPNGNPGESAGGVTDINKKTPIPADETPELTPKNPEIIPPADEVLSKQHFIIDTFHNMTSVNTDRSADVVADLKGYAEGSPAIVTYYKLSFAESNSKGIKNDADIAVHQVHKSALKIHGFEIRVTQSVAYEHSTDDMTNKLTGEALTYPGFEPSKGDRFIMEVETGKWGEFEITEIPTRMAIRSSTYFKISYSLCYWMSAARQQALDSAVFTEAYFDKKRFLNEPGALLYHDEYVDMKFLELQSAQMVRFFVTKFLDRQLMFTYMRPDGAYDPYVVDFMLKITDYAESGMIAAQLYRDAPSIENSIWRALISETIPLQAVPTGSIISKYTLGSKSVLVNSLLNKSYLAWEPDSVSLDDFLTAETTNPTSTTVGADPCLQVGLSDMSDTEKDKIIGDLLLHIHPHYRECVMTCSGCCSACGDTVVDDSNEALAYLLDGSSDYKSMIRLFFKTRKIDVTKLRTCIKNVYSLPAIQQFYKIPVYIFLARTAVRYIHRVSGIYE